MIKKIFGGIAPFFFFVCCVAADKTEEKTLDVKVEVTEVKEKPQTFDLEKGKRLYLSNCISCHNKDPNKKGALGPEVIDAPIEIMTAKVMTGRYPEVLPDGFVPKRSSKIMKPIPKLKDDIQDIYAWVQSMKPK
jgi:mono/diheme cytochrome c family protein